MKKFLKILLVIVAVAIIAMFAIGKKYHFEKSIVINAPAEKVWLNVSSMKAFAHWNPWLQLDPKMKIQYSGISGQIGDKYCWKGNEDAGQGCHEITALVPDQKVSTKMLFIKPFESDATSDVILTPDQKSTKVTWNLDCELDYPMNLMSFFMTREMSKSYGQGLAKLKEISEK